jgi:hypothetical protein
MCAGNVWVRLTVGLLAQAQCMQLHVESRLSHYRY